MRSKTQAPSSRARSTLSNILTLLLALANEGSGLLRGCAVLLAFACTTTAHADPVELGGVCFSPRGGCTALVVREIGAARHTIHVLAYSFTSDAIANALVAASRRGVDVQVVLDKSNRSGRYSDAPTLLQAHVPVAIDAAHAIAHNKTLVIDGETVLTGSFNFTNAAELHNAENMLVLRSAALAATYLANWQVHRRHATAYERKTQISAQPATAGGVR